MLKYLARAHTAGVTIAGDAGNIGTLPDAGFHRELALIVTAGLAPMDVPIAATSGGATALDRDNIGALAPGRRTDMIVLDADPLLDIANAARIYRIIKDGVAYDPDVILVELPNDR